MGFYFRKSFKSGPLRINLSKSGIGVSFGVKGLRIGHDARGRDYIHAGRYGLYYKEYFSDKDVSSEENIYNHSSNSSPFQRELRESKINILCLLIAMGIFWSIPVFRYSFIAIIYFYPTLTGIRLKTLSLKIFAMNLFTGWSVIGWLAAYAWAIPKFYTADSANPEYAEIFHNAYNLLKLVKENEDELKLLLKNIPDIIYEYINTPMESIPDRHLKQLSEIYLSYKSFKEIQLKKLPSLRHSQAKLKGYKFARTTIGARDNRLREEGLLRDEVFWEFFATKLDKRMFIENNTKSPLIKEENPTISKDTENSSLVGETINTLCGIGCLTLIIIIIVLAIIF